VPGLLHIRPNLYANLYWPTELITIVASFAVIMEIFRGSVRHNPGIVRFTQTFLVIAFALTTFYVLVDVLQRDLHLFITPSRN